MLQSKFEVTMFNTDNTTKKQTERSESMRHFVFNSVLLLFAN